MTFNDYVTKRFIGQEARIPELSILIDQAKSGNNMNILLMATSGHGKTMLGTIIAQYLDSTNTNSYYYMPNKQGTINFQEQARIHFIDEIHLLKAPETLYAHMDKDNYIFILATNEYYSLLEPLRNRCYPIQFLPYSKDNLHSLVKITLKKKKIEVSEDISKKISNFGRNNPRVLIKLTERLAFIFKQKGIPNNVPNLINIIWEILHIKKGGFTELDTRYLKFMEDIGKVASLKTIVGGTNIPITTILEDIEPFLISKRLIRITSQGRKLILGDNDNAQN